MVDCAQDLGAEAMTEFLDGLAHWHWLGLAAAALGARVLMPFAMAYTLGRGALALGLSAAIVGLALTAEPGLTVLQQLGLAVLASMASAYGLNWWAERGYRRAAHHLDRIFTTTQPIVAGRGWIEIEGESWPIRGDDLPAGAKVRVVGIAETVRVAELRRAGAAGARLEPGAPVQVVGLELALEVEPAIPGP
jgi:membrane protein implicated in regulation of membrane protease activity